MFKRILIFAALRLLKSQLLDKIAYEPLKAYIQGTYTRLEKIADVLTDKNPDDQGQLAALWESEKQNFITETIDSAQSIISVEVDNPVIRDILLETLQALEEEIRNGGDGGTFRVVAA